MANIQTEAVYTVELTEAEERRVNNGGTVEVDLPDGNVVRISGTGEAVEGVEPGSDEDADPEEIEQLVREAEGNAVASGSDTEDDEAPAGGGIITKNEESPTGE